MPEIKNPHDAFFKQLLARPGVAQDFLENYLPEPIKTALDLNDIEPVAGSFIDEELQEHLSDLIFRVRLKGGTQAFIYVLFEHKSEADRWAAWQVLRYIMRIWEQEKKQGVEKFTPVLPIVFYHGRARWRVGVNFGALVEFAGCDELRAYVPEFRYHLCDLSQYADANLTGTVLLRFGLLLMKYIFRRRELDARLEEFLALYRPLFSGSRWDFLWVALKYLMTAAQGVQRQRLQQAVQTVFTGQQGVMMQTIAEELIQENRRQWEPQVRQEAALAFTLRLLEKRFGPLDVSTTQRLRKLSVEQLEELGLAVLDFKEAKDLATWLRKHTK